MDPLSFLVLVGPLYAYFMLVLSRHTAEPLPAPALPGKFFVLMVACLNEELVIGRTLERLLALRGNLLILIIDDDSDDKSVQLVHPWLADRRVELIRRRRPNARTGKGAVLNDGLKRIEELRLSERFGAQNVIVGVFDADGRVEPGFLEAVTPHFSDDRVAGVQTGVRMYNAHRNLLTRWQNTEFTVWGQIMSRAKDSIGSATLGGNGQFARLSALRDLGPAPWRPSLTEDLDLSMRLLLRGWRIRFCSTVSVYQEAVASIRPLVRQRARWAQGHLVAWQYLGALLTSPLPVARRADLTIFLMLPALLVPVGLLSLFGWFHVVANVHAVTPLTILASYGIGFALVPLVLATGTGGGGERYFVTIIHAHLFTAYALVWFLSAIRAIWNVIRGNRGWTKTDRVAVGQPPYRSARSRSTASALRYGVGALVTVVCLTVLVGFATLEMGPFGAYGPARTTAAEPVSDLIVKVPTSSAGLTPLLADSERVKDSR